MADSLPPVLVTDYFSETRELLLFIFNRYGIPAIECPTTEEALHICQMQPVALVATNIMQPGMDGFELLTRLRSDPLTQPIPVIILTARGNLHGEKDRAFALGAEGYFDHPVSPPRFAADVKAILAKHGIVYPPAT